MPINSNRLGGVDGFVTTTGSEILTNKTISTGSKYSTANAEIITNSMAKGTAIVHRITTGTGPLNTITGGAEGNFLIIENKLGAELVITNNSGADGFITGTGADITLADDASLHLVYNSVDSRWGVVGGSGSGTGGSGELNYVPVNSQSTSTNWTESNPIHVEVSDTTTASELPRENTTGKGIKIVGTGIGSANEYVRTPNLDFDDVDTNKKCSIRFAMKPLAGYVSGGLAVRVYDVDNAAYITCSTTDIPNATGDFVTTFDSTNSVNYFLEIYKPLAATSAGIVISDVLVGPGKVVQGAAMGAWESYTPITQGFGTITNNTLEYRRVGDSIEIRGTFTTGTVTADEAQIGLPSGLTVGGNTTEISVAGFISRNTSSVTSSNYRLLATKGDSFFNAGRNTDGAGTNIMVPLPGNGGFLSSEAVSVASVTIPIAEWAGSGTVNLISDDVVYANERVKVNSLATTALTTNYALLKFTTDEYNPLGHYDSTTGIYTVPVSGKYHFDVMIGMTTVSGAAEQLSVTIKKNDQTTTSTGIVNDYISYGQRWAQISCDLELAAGDEISIHSYKSGAGANTDTSGLRNYLNISRIADYSAGDVVSFGAATSENMGLVKMDSGATTNIVPEYEEGTFTPTLQNTGTGSLSVTSAIGSYVRVGKLYTVTVSMSGITKGVATGSPYIILTGLPKPAAGSTYGFPQCHLSTDQVIGTAGCYGQMDTSDSNVDLFKIVSGANSTLLTVSDLSASGVLFRFVISYRSE